MRASAPNRPATLISFSGIDGAGKSTQIETLCQRLQDLGMKVTLIRFWDDVSRLKTLRESTGHRLFKGDKGVGTPEAPIARKDKNIRSWPMACIRLALYFIDAISARNSVNRALRSDADFIIYDRYCYDELANLNLHNNLVRRYAAQLLKIIPRLDKSYLLDADPFQARTRKPEYPLDFVYQNRAAYLQLQEISGRMIVIAPSSVEEVKQAIWRHTSEDSHLSSEVDNDRLYSLAHQHKATNKLNGPHIRPVA
jgi:thymidylate kinase